MYKVEIFQLHLHLTIWLFLTLKYNAFSIKPGSDINIKERNIPKRVILYKHPYDDKATSISQNKSKFFLLVFKT